MAFDTFHGAGKRKKITPKPYSLERQRAGLGSAAADAKDFAEEKKKPIPPKESMRFDNSDEVEHAFKKGSINWPELIEIQGFKYNFLKSFTGGLINIVKASKPGYVIYSVAKTYEKQVNDIGMGHWMVFLFKADNPSNIIPQGIAFTTAARGSAMYEGQGQGKEVIGDIAFLKIALPSGVIALKGKVDTGAAISSLHVDGKPEIVGDTVKFENHNASGNVISAPLSTQQSVKSADGGVEYRPVIILDVEVNGKPISKVEFNLNDRSGMDHEILIGQNILEKGGFLIDPNQNDVKESDEEETQELEDLSEEELDDLMFQISALIEEDNIEE